jgi:hypothetical protein
MGKDDMILLNDYLSSKEVDQEALEKLKEKVSIICESIDLQEKLNDLDLKLKQMNKTEENK